MYEDIVHQLDAYMKICIRNCVLRFAKQEYLKRTRKTSLDELSEKIYRQNGTCIRKSVTRADKKEVLLIKKRLKALKFKNSMNF